jgi:hypothetical protein
MRITSQKQLWLSLCCTVLSVVLLIVSLLCLPFNYQPPHLNVNELVVQPFAGTTMGHNIFNLTATIRNQNVYDLNFPKIKLQVIVMPPFMALHLN